MDFNQAASAIQQQVDLNNSWSAEQAQRQMDFQERMSNTAHQREVADLQAAGLNPVLSASYNGASTPSGAMASGDNSAVPALVEIMSQMAQAENARAIATLKYGSRSGATGAHNSAYVADNYYNAGRASDTRGNRQTEGNDNDGMDTDPQKTGLMIANNLFEGIFGMTPAQMAESAGRALGDFIGDRQHWVQANSGKEPAVTTRSGNSERGARYWYNIGDYLLSKIGLSRSNKYDREGGSSSGF